MSKRIFPILLTLALLTCALPALAEDAFTFPESPLLPSGIPYGNYGYPGLIALYNGDMAKVDAHMRHPRSNQQGAGISYQRVSAATVAATKGPLGSSDNPYKSEDIFKMSLNEYNNLEYPAISIMMVLYM